MRIHLFFGPGFWTLRVIQIFFPGFRIQGENLTADLVDKPRIGGFAYPYSSPSGQFLYPVLLLRETLIVCYWSVIK